jgi:hypothetical protein
VHPPGDAFALDAAVFSDDPHADAATARPTVTAMARAALIARAPSGACLDSTR